MAGSIFNFIGQGNTNSTASMLGQVNQVKQMLSGNNPQQVALNLMQRNPQFREFINANQGKSVEEICNNYGLDFNALKGVLK